MPIRASEYYTPAILALGVAFFIRSAYTLLTLPSGEADSGVRDQRARLATTTSPPPPKPVSHSAVSNVTYSATIEDCHVISQGLGRERPKLRAGALLKLIDIAAGVAARRHANTSCVTISVDSVLFLKPIFLGDLIHLSASVNRAWGTSMEIGVKVMKSDERTGSAEYVSHSYLTFVAINREQPVQTASNLARLWQHWSVEPRPVKQKKPALSPIQATSRLEARRHLLAGRRRTRRIEGAQRGEARDGVSVRVKEQVRAQVLEMLCQMDERNREGGVHDGEQADRQQRRLKAVEVEYLMRAWARQEEGITVKDGQVQVHQVGDEPFSHPEEEIRSTARALGVSLPGDTEYQMGRRLSTDFFNPPWMQDHHSPASSPRQDSFLSPAHEGTLDVGSTLTTTMHLVFPQHTNSHSIIFGGNTMSWSEDVAMMACRHIALSDGNLVGRGSWKTVAMDGLEFNVRVAVGELMILTALVVRTYRRSCEVYVMAQAEGLDGLRRFTNDVLFTLALDDDDRGKRKVASSIAMPPDSALDTFAKASQTRRQERLELKTLLTRIYG